MDLPLVKPELTDVQVLGGMETAKRYGIASVTVRPCDIDLAVRAVGGSGVKPGSVCGYPDGTQNTATKLYEARDLIRRGAKEIEMAMAISKLLSREFQHVQTELLQMAELCHQQGAILTVILPHAHLTDELKTIACVCCERAEADFVAGSTLEDVRLIRKHVPEETGVKAAGEIGTLDEAMAFLEAGATRIGTVSAREILDAWRAELAPPDARRTN